MEIMKKWNYIKKNKLSIFTKTCVFVATFVIVFAINNVRIFGNVNIFGIPYIFSIIWCRKKFFSISILYGISLYLSSFKIVDVYISLFVFGVCCLYYLVNKISNRIYKEILPYFACIIAYLPYAYFYSGDIKSNIMLVLSMMFGIMFLYVCKYFFKSTILRGFNSRLNTDEKICGGIILALIAFGFNNISFYNIDFAVLASIILVLFATYVLGNVETILLAFVFGLGVSLSNFNPISISFYVCFAVFSYVFKSKTKIFSSIAIILVYLVFTLYFDNYLIFNVNTLSAVLCISILFIFVPNKFLMYLKDVFAGYKDKLAIRNLVKESKNRIIKRLTEISKVFKEMEFTFKRTLQRTLPLQEKKDMIKQDLVDSVCRDCPERIKCLRINGEYTTRVFDGLIDAGLDKGKVKEIDLNNYILSRCGKTHYLISAANDILKSYREYNMLVNNMDCSKLLVAEQLGGVSGVITQLTEELDKDVVFDLGLETKISEDLLYKNVFCEEVIVYEKSIYEKNVVLMVKDNRLDVKVIEKTVSKSCNSSLKIISVEPSEIANVSVVTMSSKPNFDIVFGSASCNKAGTIISGDTHSFIKIDNGKYMLALSDGMGSGCKARETSDLAINLIENYYKAGFNNDIILSSVNKLLSLNNEETFSAIDLCVLDFFQNSMDFIKLGTPKSFIKKKNTIETIDSSGLPIGILEDIRPHITKKYINNFDTIILVSDGVSDAFKNDNIEVFINNLNVINPQQLADMILQKARLLNYNVCEDDMTVLVARIYPTK
ncbi:MAG: SpoIIE family protein phosphatase [Clostridia bacterium]|nr:SpoIIE family protein phosphatase [Clostridia bacterium]